MFNARIGALIATAIVLVPATYSWSQDDTGPRIISADDLLALKSVSDPQISPDGKWVAYTVERVDVEADESSTQIFMVSTDDKNVVQLTADEYSASTPRWSPDGLHLGFLAAKGDDEEAKTQVWTLDRRGGESQQFTAVDQGVSDFLWAPDQQY